jgi:hypothetical protein
VLEADLPALREAIKSAGINLRFGAEEASHLVRLSRRYDFYLRALARRLMVTLPAWIPPAEGMAASDAPVALEAEDEPIV